MTIVDEGLELLDEPECWDLLRQGVLGRVGVSISALPAIFPVNYVVENGAIVFRTAPGTKLSAAVSHAVVAFQVDDYDAVTRTGWSVLLVGQAEEATNGARASSADPWAGGERQHVIRIVPGLITGRRLVHEDPVAT